MTTPTGQPEGVSLIAYDKSLDKVVEILTAVRGTLNVQTIACNGCGQERRADFEQWQASEALQGAITRVEKATSLIKLSMLPKPPPPLC